MNKLLLSLGVLAILAAPAAAGRLDVDLSRTDGVSQITQAPAGIDLDSSQSINAGQIEDRDGPLDQSHLFGANSR